MLIFSMFQLLMYILLGIVMFLSLSYLTIWLGKREEENERKCIENGKFGVYIEKHNKRIYLSNVDMEEYKIIKNILEKYDCDIYSRFK